MHEERFVLCDVFHQMQSFVLFDPQMFLPFLLFSPSLLFRQERIAARQSVVLAKGKAALDNRQECVLNTDSYHQVADSNSKTSVGCGSEVI